MQTVDTNSLNEFATACTMVRVGGLKRYKFATLIKLSFDDANRTCRSRAL